MGSTTLVLTDQESAALGDKLGRLLSEASGVDVWLAPGGQLDVLDKDAGSECFLDYDEEARLALASVLAKLGGGGRRDGWRTIDSAPRDGTPILACRPRPAFWKPSRRAGKWYYAVTWWRSPADNAGYVGWGEFNMESWPPTHWRPIDPPGAAPPSS